MNRDTSFETPRHPIQVVARRTGLTPDALRAWERRYRAVIPHRTETGRRLYSDADIERLALLKRLITAGRSIGQIADQSRDELEALLREDESAIRVREVAGPVKERRPTSDAANVESRWLEECLAAVERYDANGLRSTIAAAALELPQTAVIERVLGPLMLEIGDRWRSGEMRIAHEHLATATVQWYLGELTRRYTPAGASCIVMATPAGQWHQVGAMLATATAISEGWQVVYLGADLPAEEIAAAATQSGAGVIGLSIVFPANDPLLPGEVAKLRRLVGDSVVILAGGRSATSYRQSLEENGAEIIVDLAELRATLERIGGSLVE